MRVVIGIAVIVGFIVIFQAMYTAVLERTREIGILKSLGASEFYIVNVVLRETALLAILGILLGIGLTFVIKAGHECPLPHAAISCKPAVDPDAPPPSLFSARSLGRATRRPKPPKKIRSTPWPTNRAFSCAKVASSLDFK